MSIWTILDWILYGLLRFVIFLIPWVKAPEVSRSIPSQWWAYNSWSDWLHYNDDDGHPDEHWCRSWLEMAFGELAKYATDKARPYVDQVKGVLLDVIGYIRGGFSSMGSWVNDLQNRIGTGTLSFASNLRDAASWLYFKLPYGIRGGWQSWDQLWDGIKASVRQWAQDRYDDARSWAWSAIAWVWDNGGRLDRWRDRVAWWIDDVKGDPYGWIASLLGPSWAWLSGFWANARATVIGWLGPEWPKLMTFGRDCASFYYNLWSKGWQSLGEFTDDPRAFVLDRLEQAVLDRW